MAYEVKVYVVQKGDHEGNLGEILAVKLTYGAAHAVAKQHAPAKVHFAVADKAESRNIFSHGGLPFK
jgi:hypothetical protein